MEVNDSQQSNAQEGDNMTDTITLATQEREKQGDNMTDTITLATQEREKQGSLECEFSFGGEADLHRHLKNCNKNPGHPKFVPVDQFNMKHIPTSYRNKEIMDYVRLLADLTVRVSVKYVSERRPETVPGSDKAYPCCSHRGRTLMRVGTGWVFEVNEYPGLYGGNKTCECKDCLNSAKPLTTFATIAIRTAAHVVFDLLEGEQTTCHLFFDKGGRPETSNGVVTLSGMSYVYADPDTDYCDMIFITHDLDLADKLGTMAAHCEYIYNKLPRPQTGPPPETWPTLTIIVSHPHGCSKQISVGHCTNRESRDNENDKFIYTTATCPGSSGAFVFVLENTCHLWREYAHVHSGNTAEKKELNYSGTATRRLTLP